MKQILISLIALLLGCAYRSYYITETNRKNERECFEIVREKQLKNSQFKKVYYKINKECREDYKQYKKDMRSKKHGN